MHLPSIFFSLTCQMIVGCIAIDFMITATGNLVTGAVSVSRVLHFVQSAGLQNAWNKRAAQMIENSWCERVTSMPALMCSLLFCCILFCSSLFYSILFWFSLVPFILFSCIVFRSILFLFRSIMLYFIQFYSILILFVLFLFYSVLFCTNSILLQLNCYSILFYAVFSSK